MSEPAHARAPSSLEDRRADRKPKSHRWTRWQHQVKKLPWLPRSKTLRQLIDELVYRADNETGEWRLYLSELAEAMGASVRTVQRRMRDLRDLGLIEYKPGRSNPKTRSWFRLVPLEAGATRCHPRGDTVSPQGDAGAPQVGRQADLPGVTPGHPRGDTVSPLTTPLLPPARPPSHCSPPTPKGGVCEVDSSSSSSSSPPQRPKGNRLRDSEQWLSEVDRWAMAQGLPVEHLQIVRQAVLMGRDDRRSVVAHLERWTEWRDGDGEPSPPAAEATEQLTLGGDEW